MKTSFVSISFFSQYCESRSGSSGRLLYSRKVGERFVAKGKYQQWLEPEGLTLLEGWARDGLTDEQIAHNMGCSVKTLYNWKNKHLPILQALKKGKEIVDIQVENALLKRALGYEYTEEKVEISEKDGKKVVQTVKHVAPDTTAQIFWLKNRRPEKWRDKPIPELEETEDSGLMEALNTQVDGLFDDDDDSKMLPEENDAISGI